MIHATTEDLNSRPGGGIDVSAFTVASGVDPLTQAFARRPFGAPGHGSRMIAEDDAEPAMRALYDMPRTAPAVAYVHVPYCQNHCLFCGFFQNVWRPDASPIYVDDVIDELGRLAATPLIASAPIEAVYLGGGTPTALAAADFARLITGIRTHLPLTSDCEITVEGRAYDFGIDKALAAIDAGANRFSLGVQTFETDLRRRLGRKLPGEEVAGFLAELVALDRASVVIDLIYGLPGATAESFLRDIDTAIDLGLDGVTLYALNVWHGGPLEKAIRSGKLGAAGDLPDQARAYAAALDRLTALGWRHASQAHVVRTARERNVYNRSVKAGTACLPFGPGAGGNAHGRRWRNVIDIERRQAIIAAGRFPIEGLAHAPPFHRAQAEISAGLESGDLDLAAVEAAAPGFRAAAQPLVDNWVDTGLVIIADNRLRTTRAGAFWMVTLASGLTSLLAALRPD